MKNAAPEVSVHQTPFISDQEPSFKQNLLSRVESVSQAGSAPVADFSSSSQFTSWVPST